MTTITDKPISKLTITWPLLPEDFPLPDNAVENTDHPLLAAALRQPLTYFPEVMQDALIVSNFALCAKIDERTICKAPDWMYVRPVEPWPHPYARRSYTPHTEGSVPFVVMEFLSATYGDEYSVEHIVNVGKWFFYERVIQVPRYVIFRPDRGRVEVYALESGRYQRQTPDANGRCLIPGLDLFLGVWEGTHEGRTGYWLRWWNAEGELLLWPDEREQQERQEKELAQAALEQERQRAEQERHFTNVWTEYTGTKDAEVAAGQDLLLAIAHGLATVLNADVTDKERTEVFTANLSAARLMAALPHSRAYR